MSERSRVPVRWLVPAAVAALVVGGGVVASASSDAVPDLPPRTAEELLVAVQEAEPIPSSGTVRTVAALGLPDLSGLAGGAGAGPRGPGGGQDGAASDPTAVLTRLLSGENELRVWVGGPDQQRVSLLDDFAELDVVRDGDVVWAYSSTEDTATRVDLARARADAEAALAEAEASLDAGERAALAEKAAELEAARADAEAAAADLTPGEVARRLLADAEATTDVAVGTPRVVAGRDAYTLTATPRDDETLLGTVEVAVDAATGHVLQVSVQARGQAEPAWLAGFASLDLDAPADSVFDFTPAPGTTVVEPQEQTGAPEQEQRTPWQRDGSPEGGREDHHEAREPVVHGEGWSTVVELALPAASGDGADWEMRVDGGAGETGETGEAGPGGADPQAVLRQLTTPVEGGRVLTSSLLTVLLTDDGRVLVGAVGPETLLQHAG